MLDAVESAYPIINATDLTPGIFEVLMKRHSCVLVRNLFGISDVLEMRGVVEQTYRRYDQQMAEIAAGRPATDFSHTEAEGFNQDRETLAGFRQFGSLVLSYSPMAFGVISTILSRSLVKTCIEEYFKQPIGLSMNSSSVRLAETNSLVRRVFHQDGNFLGGADAETINCWIALDPCGETAPGLEVFPQRVNELLPAGEAGAVTIWEIAENVAYERMGAENAWIPTFRPGDAFVFDHLHVHRTHMTEAMTRNRYAVESWMFPIKERYRSEMLAWLGP